MRICNCGVALNLVENFVDDNYFIKLYCPVCGKSHVEYTKSYNKEELKQKVTGMDLPSRMKSYENTYNLTHKVPVVIRIDGKAFHTFTKGMEKPFDALLKDCMEKTTQYLVNNIQGCTFGYTQSDEITLILTDYSSPETSAWFDYNLQKLVSVSASMATMVFNREFYDAVSRLKDKRAYEKALKKGAMFDARAFNMPKEDVYNNLVWRQLDCFRNATQLVGREYFTEEELHKKSSKKIIEMLKERGIDFYNEELRYILGSCVSRGKLFYANFTKNRKVIEPMVLEK